MNMNIKPKANIGDVVNIVGCDCVQTQYGFRIVHLFAGRDYYVHDVTVTISLKTGEVKYSYLLGRSKEANGYSGWVNNSDIELKVKEEVR